MGRIPSGLNPAHRLKLELSTNKASKHKWKARSAFWKAKYEEMERLHSGQVSGTSVESSFSTTQAELAYLASELAEQAYIAEYERACREAAEERREIATILWQSLFEGVGHALEFDQEGGQDAGLLIEENVQLTNTVGDLQRRIRELENAAASTSTTPSADERQPSSPTRGGVELKGLKDYRRVLEYGQTSSQPPPVQRMRTTGRRPTSLIAQSLSYMLVRIRSKDGNFRFELQPKDDGSLLAQKIIESTVDADVSTITISNQPRGERVPLSNLKGRTLTNLGVKHGDLIFVNYQTKAPDAPGAPSAEASTSSSSAAANTAGATPKRPWELVQEDAVDTYWRQRDGKIQRSRDPQFCKHSGNGMCDYCMPLEPYDPKYHADHNIKHLSFHAYVRKLAPAKPGAQSSTSSSLPPLDPLSYRVKVPCPSDSHPSYPAGICTKCQPSAITLQRQPFRMVDHLEFSSPALIDGFLQSWRHSGNQRIGWMIGRYMPYEDVPMGIKAVVEAIHEPPQEGEVDGLSLELPWEDEKRIEALAHDAGGLSIVGYIFTDLTPSPDDRTKSICKRHQGSYFLSSLETLFAAQLQNGRPTSTKSSSTGKFASRLVTAVLSGTPEGGIDVQAYMASEQACAMVDADMVEASVDPGIVRVKEEDGDAGRYIPDVFYRFKNEYGIEVKQSAKPCFPVEYLLVTLTHGFPTSPSPVFLSHSFPVENRPGIDRQAISQVISALSELKAPEIQPGQTGDKAKEVVKYLSDWHLLAFIGTMGVLGNNDVKVVAKTVASPNLADPHVLDPILNTEGWGTLMAIVQESAPARSSRAPPAPSAAPPSSDEIPPELLNDMGGGGGGKVCPHCTFENPPGGVDCEVCGLPLSG